MPELPERIGRYEVLGLVGRGAMGVVYRARDPLIGRIVAIKMVASSAVLPPGSQAEFKERFFREAQTAGNLHHPNIVTIYDLGEEGGVPFMALGFVEGESLAARLKRGPLPAAQALSVSRQVAQGLAYAHERGVIHRDIKPDNILLDPQGRAVITDFGIARVSASELTRTGEVLGTPTFMSPEQVRGEELDARSDLFSLGVVLYTMLSGQKPFKGDTISSVCYQVVHAEPRPSIGELALPAALAQILERLLAKDREARYSSAEEVAAALAAASEQTQAAGSGTPPSAASWDHDRTLADSGPGDNAPEPPAPPAAFPGGPPAVEAPPAVPALRRRRWLVAAGVVVLLLAALVGLVAAGRIVRAMKERSAAKEPAAAASPGAPPASAPDAAQVGEAGPRVQAPPTPETPAAPGKRKGGTSSGAAPPSRGDGASLLLVAVGPLAMGQVQVTVDGISAVHSPMAQASEREGRAGFLVAERLNLPSGPHDFRMALAAAKPGPFYAEASRRITLEAGPEQVLVVKALRFPARLQVTGPMPRSSLPPELEAAVQERLAQGGPGPGQALAGASEALGRQGASGGASTERAQIHVLMDGLAQKGELRLYLDGEMASSRRLEDMPAPGDRPGFHFEERVVAKPGTHAVRAVLDAARPWPFKAEGEGSFALEPGQRLNLRVEMERFPPRLVFVELDR